MWRRWRGGVEAVAVVVRMIYSGEHKAWEFMDTGKCLVQISVRAGDLHLPTVH